MPANVQAVQPNVTAINHTVNNPFGQQETNHSAASDSDVHRAIQEVQASMVIAKKFPRDPKMAMDRILNDCTRKSLAVSSLYSYRRGGAMVKGPSIRLAESIAQNWGNIQFGMRELSNTNNVSTLESFAWDLESNTKQVRVFHVAHTRDTRQGKRELTDQRDIYEAVANQGARRVRACILGVIPGDVIEAAVNQCEKTLLVSAEITAESLQKLLACFLKHGVTKAMIEDKLGVRLLIESVRPAQIVQLRSIYTSLKDGMAKPEDYFKITDDNNDSAERLLQEDEAEVQANDAKTEAQCVDQTEQSTETTVIKD